MSLIGALNIGKSALTVGQAAIQTTGNNIANAGNADYTRQVARISANKDQQIRPGVFLGGGINLDQVQRQIDEALQTRLRFSFSDESAADTTLQWLGRIESTLNELSDEDLSSQLSQFFNAWSDLANKPHDLGLRQIVLQSGEGLAGGFVGLREQIDSLGRDVDARLEGLVGNADELAEQIATLNAEIIRAEGGGPGQANGLRDQRDAVLKQLSQLMDIKAVQRENGMVDVYAGSVPLVIGSDNRGITLKQETVVGELQDTVRSKVVFKADNGAIPFVSGALAALDQVRDTIEDMVGKVDDLAGNLIFELNKLHSAGQGLKGYSTLTSSNVAEDAAVALNDDASGLHFKANNGSFVVHVRDTRSGLETSTLVQVDLDGLNANDTTLNSLAADLNAINGLSASVAGGRLRLSSDTGDVEFTFSQDSSGALAALGLNGFFEGYSAKDMAVSAAVKSDPRFLAAAKNGQRGDNQSALAIAALESKTLEGLGGRSLKSAYESMVNEIATGVSSSKTHMEATRVVRETLEGQREALSGVSLDEEAVNLMRYQRAYQGAARLISVVDEMMQTVLSLV